MATTHAASTRQGDAARGRGTFGPRLASVVGWKAEQMTGECRAALVRPRLSGAASGTAVPHVGGASARRGGACRPRQPSHREVQLMGARTAAAVSEGLGRTAATSSPTMIDIEGILLTSKKWRLQSGCNN